MVLRTFAGLIAFFIAYSCAFASQRADSVVIHVYPDRKTPGLEESKNLVITLPELASEIKRHYQEVPVKISVKVHEGRYHLTESLILQDLNESTQISLEPFGGDRVVFSGGIRLKSVERVTDPEILSQVRVQQGAGLYQATIPGSQLSQLRITDQGQQFQVSLGEEVLRFASYPEREDQWLHTGDVTQLTEKQVQIGYSTRDQISGTQDSQAFLFGYWNRDWYGEYQQVKAWDPAGRKLILQGTSRYGYGKGHRFRFFNVLGQLDKPGEMCMDLKKGIIYFCARDVSPGVFISANAYSLILIRNASRISLNRLIFSDSYASAIRILNSQSVALEDCNIKNVIDDAVVIRGGSNCGLNHCEIYNTGASCVILEGGDRRSLTASDHYVSQCDMGHFAQVQRVYKPAVWMEGVGQSVRDSRIHHAPHQGIRVNGNNHLIEGNEFSDLVLESGDAGAVYSGRDWTYRGNVIRNNYFHNLEGTGKLGAVAVYIDDLGSGFNISGNLFYKCNKAVQIGGGRDNTVNNNLFISCRTAVKIDNRGENTAKKQASPGGSWRMDEKINAVPVRSGIYARAFPELASLEANSPLAPMGNKVTNNIAAGSGFLDLKPDDPDYWKDILEQSGNLVNPPVSLNQSIEEMVNQLNRYGTTKNAMFRPVRNYSSELQFRTPVPNCCQGFTTFTVDDLPSPLTTTM